jgi:hypothetical protein
MGGPRSRKELPLKKDISLEATKKNTLLFIKLTFKLATL